MKRKVGLALLGSVVLWVACTVSPPSGKWQGIQSFVYQLQRARPDRIGETAFDLVVVSIGATGNSPDVIPALKNSLGG